MTERVIVFIACLIPLFGLSSCGTKRPIAQGPHPPRSPLLTATKTDLLRQVAAFYDSIHSLKIVADLTLSRGSVYKGEIVDHSDFKGYIDVRKPGDIRVVALLPLVRTTAFSMVSEDGKFRAYLGSQNRFMEGEDDAPATSPNPMENIEQREYAPDGSIVSLTKYDGWKDHSGIGFPSQIRIMRYLEEYGATLDITQLEINKTAPDSTFELQRPEGSTLEIIGGVGSR